MNFPSVNFAAAFQSVLVTKPQESSVATISVATNNRYADVLTLCLCTATSVTYQRPVKPPIPEGNLVGVTDTNEKTRIANLLEEVVKKNIGESETEKSQSQATATRVDSYYQGDSLVAVITQTGWHDGQSWVWETTREVASEW